MWLLETLLRDAKCGVRALRRTPGFTVAALLTLALVIAVNTAVFSLVDAVMLRPLPYPDADRLALVITRSISAPDGGGETGQTGRTWELVRDHATAVDRAAFSMWTTGVNIVANGQASYVQQQRAGAGFFDVLGVRPLIGHGFGPDDDRPGGPAVTVLSHTLWRSAFSGDPGVVGQSITLRGEPYTVVGVMPEGFQSGTRADLWTPLRPTTEGEGEGENYTILIRLRGSTTWPEAMGVIGRIGAEVVRGSRSPAAASQRWSLVPLQRGLTDDLRSPLLMMWAAVAVVLVVGCVNLAGLLLARAFGRTREIATRMALGSGRNAVVRQLLVESLVLAVIGGTAGVLLAHAALDAFQRLAQGALDVWQPVAIDGRALAGAAGLTGLATVLFGLAPALQAARLDVQIGLTGGGARTIAGRSSRLPRRVLVVAQVALGVVLLVSAGLLMRSVAHLRALNPGFEPAHVMTASLSLQDARYDTTAKVEALFNSALERMRRIPGVEAAAVSLGLPYERLLNLGFRHLEGPEAAAAQGPMTSAAYVTDDFFETLRLPIRRGRTFDERDTATSPAVVVINERFATSYFKGEDPIGRRILLAGRERQVVGVVGDVPVRPGWGDNGPLSAMPLTYIPVGQVNDGFIQLVHGWFTPTFLVRSAASPELLGADMRRALQSVDPFLPFAEIRSMSAVQSESIARERFLMSILVALAAATLALAALGIHGLIATSVTERTREIGIRLALGATMGQALRELALPGLKLALAGTMIGAVAAVASSRLLRHFLWGVRPGDPATFVTVALLLLTVACAASVVPALRILRLDPATTLRHE